MLLLYKDKILKELIEKYTKRDKSLESIVLYGSVARDDYTANSDIDILLITLDIQHTKEIFSQFRSELYSTTGITITAIYSNYQNFLTSIEPLYNNIRKEGKTLWKRKRI